MGGGEEERKIAQEVEKRRGVGEEGKKGGDSLT